MSDTLTVSDSIEKAPHYTHSHEDEATAPQASDDDVFHSPKQVNNSINSAGDEHFEDEGAFEASFENDGVTGTFEPEEDQQKLNGEKKYKISIDRLKALDGLTIHSIKSLTLTPRTKQVCNSMGILEQEILLRPLKTFVKEGSEFSMAQAKAKYQMHEKYRNHTIEEIVKNREQLIQMLREKDEQKKRIKNSNRTQKYSATLLQPTVDQLSRKSADRNARILYHQYKQDISEYNRQCDILQQELDDQAYVQEREYNRTHQFEQQDAIQKAIQEELKWLQQEQKQKKKKDKEIQQYLDSLQADLDKHQQQKNLHLKSIQKQCKKKEAQREQRLKDHEEAMTNARKQLGKEKRAYEKKRRKALAKQQRAIQKHIDNVQQRHHQRIDQALTKNNKIMHQQRRDSIQRMQNYVEKCENIARTKLKRHTKKLQRHNEENEKRSLFKKRAQTNEENFIKMTQQAIADEKERMRKKKQLEEKLEKKRQQEIKTKDNYRAAIYQQHEDIVNAFIEAVEDERDHKNHKAAVHANHLKKKASVQSAKREARDEHMEALRLRKARADAFKAKKQHEKNEAIAQSVLEHRALREAQKGQAKRQAHELDIFQQRLNAKFKKYQKRHPRPKRAQSARKRKKTPRVKPQYLKVFDDQAKERKRKAKQAKKEASRQATWNNYISRSRPQSAKIRRRAQPSPSPKKLKSPKKNKRATMVAPPYIQTTSRMIKSPN